MSKPSAAPATTAVAAPSPALHVAQTRAFLDSVFHAYPSSDFAFRLWDGTLWQKPGAPLRAAPRFTVVLNHPAALRRMFLPPSDTRLALAYTKADFDLLGDAAHALYLGKHLWDTWSWRDAFRNALLLLRLPSSATNGSDHTANLSGAVHSQSRDKRAIQYHYDVSNDFYRLWLDRRMVYSCAYFHSPDESIDVAQKRKLDYICRKLRLKSGDHLLDIGCGWGALVIYAAKHYGVTALGVTLSEKQVTLARERVAEEGLTDSCTIELLDYRNVDETQPFDKIVSIGMVEHVGRENLRTYFDKAYRLLRPGGTFLNHGITLLHDEFKSIRAVKNGFFAKYIFPDGDLQPLTYILQHATAANFEVRDLESLREHYALTLKCWRLRFEEHEKEIVDMMGMESYRLWKLYLLGAGWGFDSGLHSIYQTVLYKGNETGSARSDLPLTRDDWYQED